MNIEKHIIHLIKHEPYYAEFLQLTRIGMSKTVSPTAAAFITDRCNITLNPDFMATLTFDEQVSILKHEVLHFIFEHFSKPNKDQLSNIAADLSINQYIPNLPDGCMVPEKFQDYDEPMKTFESFEYYYEWLKRNLPEGPGGFGCDSLDDHSKWKELSEYEKEVIADTIKKAQSRAGHTPGYITEVIKKRLTAQKNWKKELRQFIALAESADRESTRKKRDRRYGLLQPGKKSKPSVDIAVLVDISGSVSDKYLEVFFAEIDRIHFVGLNVKVVTFDTEVRDVFDYSPRDEIKINGRGGTNFSCAFDKARELDVSGIICFTDGGDYGIDCKKPDKRVLWALTEDHDLCYPWGKQIVLKESEK